MGSIVRTVKLNKHNMRYLLVLSLLATFASGFTIPPRATITAPTLTALKSFGDLKGIADLFSPKKINDSKKPVIQYDTVVIEPDFRCAALFLVAGAFLDTIPYIQFTLGLFVTLLGVLFLVQTFRIRFIFNQDNVFELATVGDKTGELRTSGENIVVGGENKWACDTIVNYDFFPKGWIDLPIGPILVYFKETQTPSEQWNKGPGAQANASEKVSSGYVAGFL
jgi:hypothetical protein